jgi:hypothetical protein
VKLRVSVELILKIKQLNNQLLFKTQRVEMTNC